MKNNLDQVPEEFKQLAEDFGKNFSKDFGKDFSEDFGKNFSKKFGKDFSTIFIFSFFCGFLWVMKRKFEKCDDVGILVKKSF